MDEFLVLLLTLAIPGVGFRLLLFGRERLVRRQWERRELALATEAVRAFKVAHVLVHDQGGQAQFAGIAFSSPYTTEATAVCADRGCAAPGLACECGFYALKDPRDARAYHDELAEVRAIGPAALCQVSLSGEILQYERGYRARRQRVDRVEIERVCRPCARQGRRRRAAALAAPHCPRPPIASGGAVHVRSALPPDFTPAQPVCGSHIPDDGVTLSPWQLGALLGTDVDWLTETAPDGPFARAGGAEGPDHADAEVAPLPSQISATDPRANRPLRRWPRHR